MFRRVFGLTLAAVVLFSGTTALAQRGSRRSSGSSFSGSRTFSGGGGSFKGGSSSSFQRSSSFDSGSSRRSSFGSDTPRASNTFGATRSGTSTFGRTRTETPASTGIGGSFNPLGRTRSNPTTSGTFGRPNLNPPRSMSPSAFGRTQSAGGFGRTGSFGASNGINRGYSRSTNMYVASNGISAPVRGYGGFRSYSFYWGAPAWYYHTPFHPAFYYHPPVYVGTPGLGGGYYEPGGFNFMNLILGIVIIGILGLVFFFVVLRGIFRAIRGNSPRYQNYG